MRLMLGNMRSCPAEYRQAANHHILGVAAEFARLRKKHEQTVKVHWYDVPNGEFCRIAVPQPSASEHMRSTSSAGGSASHSVQRSI